MEENANILHFLITSNFVIHPQILIFSLFKIASLSPYWLQINFSVSLFFYLLLQSICAHTEENIETIDDLVPSQEDKPQTHRTVREISRRRVFIGRLCSRLFVRTCIWNVSRGAVYRSSQTRAALLAWRALSFCFRISRSLPLTSFSLWMKRCSRLLHLTLSRTKISGRLQELLKKRFSVFFSAGTAQSAAAWPPVNCACVLQLSEQPTNTTLCPALLRKFVCQLFAVYPFKYKLFIKILCSSLNTMLIVDKHCSDICCDEYLMPKIDRKSKQVKEQWHGQFYLQSVRRKTRYFKHRKYQNLWMNNKVINN